MERRARLALFFPLQACAALIHAGAAAQFPPPTGIWMP